VYHCGGGILYAYLADLHCGILHFLRRDFSIRQIASRKTAEIVHFSHIVCSNDAKLRLFCAGAYFFSEKNAMFL
jgi:hypothetical protein